VHLPLGVFETEEDLFYAAALAASLALMNINIKGF